MGAVIDEQMQNRVEVCVLGTSDMGVRGAAPRKHTVNPSRPRSALRGEPTGGPATPAPAPEATPGEAPAGPAEAAQAAAAAKAAQEEFGFGELESRGHFEKTDRNLFDGQDLDVPTYLRKGIKITV
jgi:cell division protein FtsZ